MIQTGTATPVQRRTTLPARQVLRASVCCAVAPGTTTPSTLSLPVRLIATTTASSGRRSPTMTLAFGVRGGFNGGTLNRSAFRRNVRGGRPAKATYQQGAAGRQGIVACLRKGRPGAW